MYIRIGIWCLLFLCTLSAQARIYKWVDAAGQVHFSDHPGENAQELRLGEQAPIAAPNATGYTSLDMVQPGENQIFQNDQGEVAISLRLQPNLKPGHEIQVIIDGGLIPSHFTNTQFTLKPVADGIHKLYAIVMDAEGNKQITSKTVTFNVHKEPPKQINVQH